MARSSQVREHNGGTNTYEEARKLRLQENKQRFQDLGISNISKSLSNLTRSEKKFKQRLPNTKPKPEKAQVIEPRRSSRVRSPVHSYRDDLDIDYPLSQKRSRSRSRSSSWASYIARPLDEIKNASYEERAYALKAAEEFQSNLESGNPSFVKSMVRSHVYSCFWLGLPTHFCKSYLKEKDLDITLVDENGLEYEAKYLGKRTGLSGGWRGYALDHKLDDGDAVVFELVEPYRFKVYIFRVSSLSNGKHGVNIVDRKSAGAKNVSEGMKHDSHSSQKQKLRIRKSKEDESNELLKTLKKMRTRASKADGDIELSKTQKPQSPAASKDDVNQVKKNRLHAQDREAQLAEDKDKHDKRVLKPRKKPPQRLLRKRA